MLGESRQLERLVNDFLELSRLQDSGFRLQMEEVDLQDVIRDAARSIRREAAARGIAVETVLPEAECLIRGDYGRLRQLLLILLDNAVKFSAEQEPVRILLEQGENWRISLWDRGREIPKEELSVIFQRYHTARTPENPRGNGLGLAIAGEIVKRHHGRI